MSLFSGLFSSNDKDRDDTIDLDLVLPFGCEATILVVDDSKTVLFSCEKMLKRLGFNCLTALSAKEGIEIARDMDPDLILMDVVMPEMNGFQATRTLRKMPETRHIPIIIMSSNKMQTEQLWSKRQGANGFLPKPLNRKDFLALSLQLIDKQRQAEAV